MVLKNIERDPEYKRLLDDGLDEVAPHVRDSEGAMTEREGFIFLSAPGSMTPSHTDPEHNFLLQVRGSKQMNVGSFPDERTEQLALEQALGGGHRNLWEPHDALAFALTPGDGVYVAPHAPHWVQNGGEVSVSLSITFATAASENRRRVHSINARLRRLGLSPTPPVADPAPTAARPRARACWAGCGRPAPAPDARRLGRYPARLRGTSTARLNSATSTPSWLSTRVCTLTVPRSSLVLDSRFSSTSDSQ